MGREGHTGAKWDGVGFCDVAWRLFLFQIEHVSSSLVGQKKSDKVTKWALAEPSAALCLGLEYHII